MPTGLNDTALNIGNAAIQAAITRARLYTAEPDAAGVTNQASSGLVAITWDTAANGDIVLTADATFTGGASNGPCTHVGLWNTAGTVFYGYFALTDDLTFNAAGEYVLTGITITGTSS